MLQITKGGVPKCKCMKGYHGPVCERKKEHAHCASSPCQNGGTCKVNHSDSTSSFHNTPFNYIVRFIFRLRPLYFSTIVELTCL